MALLRESEISAKDSPSIDAFSLWRISSPESLFSVQCQYNEASLVMETGSTGDGSAPAHSANDRMVKLSSAAGSGTSFIQSYQYIPYQPGKSHLVFITGLFDTGVSGATADVGYFDSANGIFVRQNGTGGLQIIRRTSTSGSIVNNAVDQADWNIDPFNGNGVSGITFDETKVFIMIIDLQFLGMGRVRVGFDVDGKIYYVHEFKNANSLSVPYMQTASLPVGMLLTTSGTGSVKNCYFKCASVNSEGGLAEDFAFRFSTPECTVTAGNGARTHLVSVRPKTTFNSITNRETFAVSSVDILVTGNSPVFWELCLGQAISGTTTFNDINTTYSAFEYNNAGTISGTPTLVIDSGYCAASNQNKTTVSRKTSLRYPITLDRAGAVRAMGTITLIVTGIGGSSATRAAINFEEIR